MAIKHRGMDGISQKVPKPLSAGSIGITLRLYHFYLLHALLVLGGDKMD